MENQSLPCSYAHHHVHVDDDVDEEEDVNDDDLTRSTKLAQVGGE